MPRRTPQARAPARPGPFPPRPRSAPPAWAELPRPLRRLRRTRALTAALTHPSLPGPETAGLRHLRLRLELLGDAVWNLAVLHHIFREAGAPRADLARRKAHLAGGAFMADVARQIGLDRALRTGAGPAAEALRRSPTVLAGSLEAILAAWFLQDGLPAILRYVHRLLSRATAAAGPGGGLDAKSELQHVVSRRFHTLPLYRMLERTGTPHAPEFLVEVAVQGEALGVGRGGSRRAAEQAAARAALAALVDRTPDPNP